MRSLKKSEIKNVAGAVHHPAAGMTRVYMMEASPGTQQGDFSAGGGGNGVDRETGQLGTSLAAGAFGKMFNKGWHGAIMGGIAYSYGKFHDIMEAGTVKGDNNGPSSNHITTNQWRQMRPPE